MNMQDDGWIYCDIINKGINTDYNKYKLIGDNK